MPPIPKAKRTRTIPGISGEVKTDVKSAGVVGRGISGIADQVGSLISDRAAVLKDQDNKNKEIIFKTQYDDDHRVFKSSELDKTGSDSFENQKRGDDFRKSMVDKYTKDIKDPNIKNAYTQYINSRSGNMLDSLSTHQSRQRSAVSDQARSLTMAGLLKDAFAGESLEDINSRWAQTIVNQNDLGIISEEQAIEELQIGESNLAEAHLDGIIDADPTAAIELINSGFYNEFLTQEQQEDFGKIANQLEAARDKDIENQQKEQERLNKIAVKEAQTATGNEFLEKNLNGLLTQTDVLNSNLNPTGENGKKTWIKAIEDRAKKVKKNAEKWETDLNVKADFQTKITLDPNSVTDDEIMAMQGIGLSTEDAKGLVSFRKTRLGKEEDPQKTQDAKSAYIRLREAKRDDLFSGNEAQNSKEWAESVSQLEQWINNHPKDDPADYVDDLLEPAKDGFLRRMFDFVPGVDPFKSEEARQRDLDIEAGIDPDNITTITTQEEFNALPSGTVFIEDGLKYRKP